METNQIAYKNKSGTPYVFVDSYQIGEDTVVMGIRIRQRNIWNAYIINYTVDPEHFQALLLMYNTRPTAAWMKSLVTEKENFSLDSYYSSTYEDIHFQKLDYLEAHLDRPYLLIRDTSQHWNKVDIIPGAMIHTEVVVTPLKSDTNYYVSPPLTTSAKSEISDGIKSAKLKIIGLRKKFGAGITSLHSFQAFLDWLQQGDLDAEDDDWY